MDNPFETIGHRLDKIEKLLAELHRNDNTIPRCNISPDPQQNSLIKIDQAAFLTGYKSGYLYELVHKNAIPYIRRGRSIRFDPEELDTWMRAGHPVILKEAIRRMK